MKKIITDTKLLRRKCEPCSGNYTQVADDLIAAMKRCYHPKAIGLAAPQIGHLYRVCVVMSGTDYLIVVNPVIDRLFGKVNTVLETCLSSPGIQIPVSRHRKVRVKFLNGKTHGWESRTFRGLGARVIQHEIDHLDGILMDDKDARKKEKV